MRDRKPLEEGCSRNCLCRIATRETICEQHISGKEKGWGKQVSHQLEEVK